MRIKALILFACIFLGNSIKSQDTSKPWFPGGEDGFYDYLNSRLLSLGSQRVAMNIQGESVIFEFIVSDSGWIDSVKIGYCFNVQLGMQLSRILNTMPRVNAAVIDGKTQAVRRVFSLDIKPGLSGYSIEPSAINPMPVQRASKNIKIGAIFASIVLLMVFIFK